MLHVFNPRGQCHPKNGFVSNALTLGWSWSKKQTSHSLLPSSTIMLLDEKVPQRLLIAMSLSHLLMALPCPGIQKFQDTQTRLGYMAKSLRMSSWPWVKCHIVEGNMWYELKRERESTTYVLQVTPSFGILNSA